MTRIIGVAGAAGRRLVVLAVAGALAGCAGGYRIEQARKLTRTLGDTQTLLAAQYVDALSAYRTQHILEAAADWNTLDAAGREDRFAGLVCEHNLYAIGLAQETFGAQSQVLGRAAADPSSATMGATLKALRAKAVGLAPPDAPQHPSETCRTTVREDLARSRTKSLAAVTAGVGAVTKLIEVFRLALGAIEQQQRGERLAALLKKDEGAIWAAYYLLACPRNVRPEDVPQGRPPEPTRENPLGCGSGTSAYQAMLDETRIHFARVSYAAFQATAASRTPALAPVRELLGEVSRYDLYRLASAQEKTDAGLVLNLRTSTARLVDAVVAGPTSFGDQLDAANDGVANLEALLKAWSDYKAAYADYRTK